MCLSYTLLNAFNLYPLNTKLNRCIYFVYNSDYSRSYKFQSQEQMGKVGFNVLLTSSLYFHFAINWKNIDILF